MYSTTYASSALALASIASASCYSGGLSKSGIEQIGLQAVNAVCAVMIGSFASGQSRDNCATAIDDEWYFMVKRIGDVAILNMANCTDGLKKEITGCQKGGDSRYTNWEYRADPGNGVCQDISATP